MGTNGTCADAFFFTIRQITKYLNECRNRESDNQGLKSALKLKVRKSEPPPVPKVDYADSVADDDSCQDGGWDTDFDDDLEDDDEASLNGEKEHGSKSQTSINSRIQDRLGGSPQSTRANSHPAVPPKLLGRSISDDTTKGNNDRPERPVPKPPSSIITISKVAARPQSALIRPQQQPPPPPPAAAAATANAPAVLKMLLQSTQLRKTVDSPSNQENGGDAHDEPDVGCDNYEIPLGDGGGSKASSVDLQVDSGSGSIDLSTRSSNSSPLHYPTGGRYNGSQNQSQLDIENELEQEENYEAVDESQWSGSSSGVSVMSSQSDRPALPPKGSSPSYNTPPPLPQKPQQRQRIVSTPPLPMKDRPRKISDESPGKTRQRNGCKQVLSTLFNFTSKITSDRRAESMLGVDKVTTPERETMPSPGEPSNLKKSISASSLRYGYGDTLSLVGSRPLPPVPNRQKPEGATLHDSPVLNILESQLWFQRVERETAETILKRMGESGCYLVRESRRAGQFNPYTLSIYFCEKIFHLNIRHRPDGKFALGKEKENEKTFASVIELINFHQREVILLTARGMQIGQTCLVQCPSKP